MNIAATTLQNLKRQGNWGTAESTFSAIRTETP